VTERVRSEQWLREETDVGPARHRLKKETREKAAKWGQLGRGACGRSLGQREAERSCIFFVFFNFEISFSFLIT
jgi:hypothetical protein